MKEIYVDLQNPNQIQNFVKTLTTLDGEFELISGKYILDARSLMGIFSLDLSKPILLKIYDPTEKTLDALKPYIAKLKGEQ